MTPSALSNERLAEIETWTLSEQMECAEDDMPVSAQYFADVSALITELQSYRSEGVTVKDLEWREIEMHTGVVRWFGNGISTNLYVISETSAKTYWLSAYENSVGTFGTLEAAQAAAQLDYATRIKSALSPSTERGETIEPDDLQLLMHLKRDNVWDGARPVVESDFEQCFRLSEQGLIALEQVAQGVRLHITRLGVKAIDRALNPRDGGGQ